MKLNAAKFGLAGGIFWAAIVCICTLVATWTGFTAAWLNAFVATLYPGYTVSLGGSVLGLIYGFLDGLIGGWLFASIYNKLLK